MGVCDGAGRVCAWGLVEHVPELDRLGLMSLDGTTDGITALARAVRAHAAVLSKEMVEVVTPPHPRALQALEAAGYHIELDPGHPEDVNEHGIDVFELRLDQT